MIRLEFTLTFDSDWHIGAGYSGGIVDSVIERDSDGLPIIRGATLKGIFRDALYDLASLGSLQSIVAAQLDTYNLDNVGEKAHHAAAFVGAVFGSPQSPSRWRFNTARPKAFVSLTRAKTRSHYAADHVVSGVRISPRTRRAEHNKYFRHEVGSSGVYEFSVEGNGDQAEIEWLIAAARFIRRLGGKRRRGAGSCEIVLKDMGLQTQLLESFGVRIGTLSKQPDLPDLKSITVSTPRVEQTAESSTRYRLTVRTEQPVVIAERPEAGNIFDGRDTIPGQAIRGALARRIENLATLQTDDAKNGTKNYQQFADFFLLGGVAFTHLTPLLPDATQTTAEIAITMPLGLRKRRTDEAEQPAYHSTLHEKDIKEAKSYTGLHRLVDGFPKSEQRLNGETHIHVQINPETKRALDANLYGYTAIPSGRWFVGEITFQSNQSPSEWFSQVGITTQAPFDLIVGKGSGRGYGACRCWIEPIPDDAPPTFVNLPLADRLIIQAQSNNGFTLYLTLASDTILIDDWGRAIQRFDETWLSRELGIEVVAIEDERQVVRLNMVDSFDGRSGLPRPRDIALAAGSSARLRVSTIATEQIVASLVALEQRGIGLRRSEGFGRIIFNHPAHTGKTDTFGGTISLPSELVPSVRKELSAAEFATQWREVLQNMTKLSSDVDVLRAVARLLVQEQGAQNAMTTLITEFGSSGDKEARFNKNDRETLQNMLIRLATYGTSHWRHGLILLAEAMISRAATR